MPAGSAQTALLPIACQSILHPDDKRETGLNSTFLDIGSCQPDAATVCKARECGFRTCTAGLSQPATFLQEEEDTHGEDEVSDSSDVLVPCSESVPLHWPAQRCTSAPQRASTPQQPRIPLCDDTPHWAPTPRWANWGTQGKIMQDAVYPSSDPAVVHGVLFQEGHLDAGVRQIMLPVPWEAESSLPATFSTLEPGDVELMSAGVEAEDGNLFIDLKMAVVPSSLSASHSPVDPQAPWPVCTALADSTMAAGLTYPMQGSLDPGSGAAWGCGLFFPERSTATIGHVFATAAAAAAAVAQAGVGSTHKSPQVCCHWKSKGWCRYESCCKFLHPEHKRGMGAAPDAISRGRRRRLAKQLPEVAAQTDGQCAHGQECGSAAACSRPAVPVPLGGLS